MSHNKGVFIMISEINVIKEKIEALKDRIDSLNRDLAQVDSSIDTLECYTRSSAKLSELYEESDRIEKSKTECRDEIVRLNNILANLEKIKNLKNEQNTLEETLKNEPNHPDNGVMIFKIGSIKQEIAYYESIIVKTANEINKNKR